MIVADRLDDHQDVRPARPEPGEHEPEGAVGLTEAWAARRAPQVGQLLAKGKVLQGEIRTRPESRAQCAKDAEQQGRHRAMMHDDWPLWPDSKLIVVTVGKRASRMSVWRSTTGVFVAGNTVKTNPTQKLPPRALAFY